MKTADERVQSDRGEDAEHQPSPWLLKPTHDTRQDRETEETHERGRERERERECVQE